MPMRQEGGGLLSVGQETMPCVRLERQLASGDSCSQEELDPRLKVKAASISEALTL